MSTATPKQAKPAKLPMEFYERPACKQCGSPDLQAYRSTGDKQGDGSIARHTRCRSCGYKFLAIYEISSDLLPDIGEHHKHVI